MPSVAWFSIHPKVVAAAVGSGLLAAVTAVLANEGHPMPQDVVAALTALAAAVGGWLLTFR